MTNKHNSSPWIGVAKNKTRYYKGLRQKTDLYVHDKIIQVLKENGRDFTAGPVRILDLGCGEGALSLRLHDEGADVLGVDVDEESFHAEGPLFKVVNFDDSGSVDSFIEETAGDFDVIIASEVIEHVRNPWDLLKTIKRLAHPNTDIIITTPNVASWWGRFWFFITGELWGFTREGWVSPGHINPITSDRFHGIAGDCGFCVEESVTAGVLPIIWAYNWKRLIVSIVCVPFRVIQKGPLDGWVRLYRIKVDVIQ